jgi:protein TonB
MPAQHPAPASEEPPTPEKAQQRYLKEHFAYIRDLITKQLVYPTMARKMSWSGKTVVAFVINEDGTVHNIRVVETSGYPILDKSATETVRNVAPFPKPPVRAEIVVPISFKMM